ncbi:MAG: 1-phosphofructokinase family hexose kinase [Clostridia bacterium]|jgi:1-phosphofructokinase|nr:1-phosphofructokinase family hexose kinase [Clostridia bacterium]MBQ2463010.1 1-phosphofructokinase family hexose kinase [Clostridia bacterium]MBQ9291085.1 1-phosphofructokinase family hexose kinase [Clostridia bacterium]MBR0215398.1 1-phosphofructokinase family hexose kinase [Clostridia bacterium]
MISTFCLNPSFDKTVEVSAFRTGGTNRILRSRVDPGGKGVNVARVLKTLGMDVRCVCALPDKGKEEFLELLSEENLEVEAISTPGTLRTNTKIFSQDSSRVTELNESGVPLSSKALEDLAEKEAELKNCCDMHVLSGSLPPHASEAMYYNMIQTLSPSPVFLDASGKALLEGIKARPLFVKPNLAEMEAVFDRPLRSRQEVQDAAYHWIDQGVGHVVVSMGGQGAMLVTADQTVYSPAIDVKVQSTVGAGDAMVAGMIYAYVQHMSLEDMLRCGTAAAAASCMTTGTQMVRLEDYEAMLSKSVVQAI